MINFPILKSLEVEGFELYPGTVDKPGLSVEFQPGVTLVIGANGLGKSTLILMLFRLLSGPADLKGLGREGLGSGQLEVRSLRSSELRTFSARVSDAAADATARLYFSLGKTQISVARDLSSLAMTSLVVDDVEQELDEAEFQSLVCRHAGLDDFLDWLLILRYLIFYFDDRPSLVWDPTAQRRMLPLIFLPGGSSDPAGDLIRAILTQDSAVRNLNAALTKQENELRGQERLLQAMPLMRRELEQLTGQRASIEEEMASLQDQLTDLEGERASARQRALQASEHRVSFANALERLRLQEVRRAFPSTSESAAYLITKVLSEETCAVCGNEVPGYAQELKDRLERDSCIVCDSDHAAAIFVDGSDPQDIVQARRKLVDASEAFEIANEDRESAEAAFTTALSRLAELDRDLAGLAVQIERLEKSLPDEGRALSRRREAINELRMLNAAGREQVLANKARLAQVIDAQNLQLSEYQQSIKTRFDDHAEAFLLESCSLVWGKHLEPIGQIGRPISFSVFHVDMTGGAVESATRRETAQQVSESQQEFIDIAFRMALVGLAGDSGRGTLVMDAPESSLDAVFAPRAARVLTSFADGNSESRVVITSNLVDGQLIPTIARYAGISSEDDDRVVNLFEVAAPTAALRQLHAEYAAALSRAFTVPGAR